MIIHKIKPKAAPQPQAPKQKKQVKLFTTVSTIIIQNNQLIFRHDGYEYHTSNIINRKHKQAENGTYSILIETENTYYNFFNVNEYLFHIN